MVLALGDVFDRSDVVDFWSAWCKNGGAGVVLVWWCGGGGADGAITHACLVIRVHACN